MVNFIIILSYIFLFHAKRERNYFFYIRKIKYMFYQNIILTSYKYFCHFTWYLCVFVLFFFFHPIFLYLWIDDNVNRFTITKTFKIRKCLIFFPYFLLLNNVKNYLIFILFNIYIPLFFFISFYFFILNQITVKFYTIDNPKICRFKPKSTFKISLRGKVCPSLINCILDLSLIMWDLNFF